MLDRTQAPQLHILKLPELQNPVEVENGIFLFEKIGPDVFRLDIVFPKGGNGNSQKPFLNSICADLLLSGTENKNANQINEELDFFGSYISTSTSYYKTVLTIYGINKFFKEVTQIVFDALNHASFPEKEIELLAEQKVSQLYIQQKKTAFQSKVLANQTWFGKETILGTEPIPEHYSNATREYILNHYNSNFRTAFAVLSSNESIKQEIMMLKSLFDFQSSISKNFIAETVIFQPFVANKANKTMSESNQAGFCARIKTVSRLSDDYPSLSMFNLLLGGYFGSRLMKNIREEKGWTYGVQSQIKNYREQAFIEISGEITADKAEEVFAEIQKEINLLLNQEVSAEEFETARNYYIGNLQNAFDSFYSLSDRFITMLESGQDLEWYNYLGRALNEISPKQMKELASKYLKKETLLYTWAGPNT